MDSFAMFAIPIIKELIAIGYIKCDEEKQKYYIVSFFKSATKGAILLLSHYLKKLLGISPITSKVETEIIANPIFDTIIGALMEIVLPFKTIISYIKRFIDFLQRLFKGADKDVLYNPPIESRPPAKRSSKDDEIPVDDCSPEHKVNSSGNIIGSPQPQREVNGGRSVQDKFTEGKNLLIYTETRSVSLSIEAKPKNNDNFNTGFCIVGSNFEKNSYFEGVEKKCFYHVGNVDQGTSKDDILQYLNNLIPNSNFTCTFLNSNGYSRSFKVGGNFSDKRTLELPLSWPEGVIISSFQFKKKNTGINDKALEPVNGSKSHQMKSFQYNNNNVRFEGARKIYDTTFKAAEQKCWYYVGRVSKGTSELDMLKFMVEKIPNGNFFCKTLKSEGRTMSFKVSVNASVKDIVESPDFWPRGVLVRNFHQYNNNQNRPRINSFGLNSPQLSINA